MNAYPLHACKGDSCNQGRAPCKTEAICTTALHRFTPRLSADEVTSAEYDEITTEATTFDKVMYAISIAAFVLSAVVVVAIARFFWVNREILLGLML